MSGSDANLDCRVNLARYSVHGSYEFTKSKGRRHVYGVAALSVAMPLQPSIEVLLETYARLIQNISSRSMWTRQGRPLHRTTL